VSGEPVRAKRAARVRRGRASGDWGWTAAEVDNLFSNHGQPNPCAFAGRGLARSEPWSASRPGVV